MITYELMSEKGKSEINEDCVGMYEKNGQWAFFLADGLGGCDLGEIASKTVIEQSMMQFAAEGFLQDTLKVVFEASQRKLLELQKERNADNQMRTTLAAVMIDDDKIQWGHSGDSRVYYFKDGFQEMRTSDHSVPQMLVDAGMIKTTQIRFHPDRNRLLKVVGKREGFAYEIEKPIRRQDGRQAILICSDGFWEWIPDWKMSYFLRRAKTVEEWLKQMKKYLLKHSKKERHTDNYSAVGIWIGENAVTMGEVEL